MTDLEQDKDDVLNYIEWVYRTEQRIATLHEYAVLRNWQPERERTVANAFGITEAD
jgi:hypothetical protein